MTLLDDLSCLTDPAQDPSKLVTSVFRLGIDRRDAYDTLAAIARRGEIGLVRAFALLLKYTAEFEAQHNDLTKTDQQSATRAMLGALAGFPAPNDATVDVNQMALLMRELLLLGLDRVPTHSPALTYVSEQWRDITAQLADADALTAKRFVLQKSTWIEQNQKVRQLSKSRRQLVERIDLLQREFLATYAAEYLAECEARSRLEVAHRHLESLRENPILAADAGPRAGGRRFAQRVHAQYANGRLCLTPLGQPESSTNSEQVRATLRKLAMLTHPDRVAQLTLGNLQRQQLHAIWHETNLHRTHNKQLHATESTVLLLEGQLQNAQRILEYAAIDDLDTTLVTQGQAIDEQIQWLENANARLEQEVDVLQRGGWMMSAHAELNYLQAMTNAPPDVQEEQRTAFRTSAAHYRVESEKLEHAAQELLAKRA